jgi:hypothetical protein
MTLNLKLVHNEPSVVKLYGVDGKIKLQTTLQAAKSSIDLGRLKAGNYIVQLSNSILSHTMSFRVL